MQQNIKIIKVEGYDFPQPKYCFGQTVIDKDFDIGFIVGMEYVSNEWEYRIFFTELEVLGASLYNESDLSLEVVEV